MQFWFMVEFLFFILDLFQFDEGFDVVVCFCDDFCVVMYDVGFFYFIGMGIFFDFEVCLYQVVWDFFVLFEEDKFVIENVNSLYFCGYM